MLEHVLVATVNREHRHLTTGQRGFPHVPTELCVVLRAGVRGPLCGQSSGPTWVEEGISVPSDVSSVRGLRRDIRLIEMMLQEKKAKESF